MTRVIAVLNQKGGVGKTTTAINLARFLGESRYSTLVIDLDPQGNSSSGLGVDKNNLRSSSYDLIINEQSDPSQVIVQLPEFKIDLIPANQDLAGAEVELASALAREQKLKKQVDKLTHDYIIIDCPPSLGLLTVNALTASSEVLIPVQAEYYALEGVSQLIDVVSRIKQNLNPSLRVLGVLLTMYDPRTSLSGQVYDEVKRFFGDLVFDSVIPRNVKLAEAPSHGKPIIDYDKWSKGAKAYKQLTKEVIKRAEN